jgi:hypothetical protein
MALAAHFDAFGIGRFRAVAIAHEADDGVALLDIGVQLLQERAGPRVEILLDLDVEPLFPKGLGHFRPVGTEFLGDGAEEDVENRIRHGLRNAA